MAEITLEQLRREIDELDGQLLRILSDRAKVVHKIGTHKKQTGQNIRDEKRWKEVVESRLLEAKKLGLNEDFIGELLALLHSYSLQIEKDD